MEEVLYTDLGTIDYGECWALQQRLFDGLVSAKAAGNWKNPPAKKAEDAAGTETSGMFQAGALKAEQYLLLCEHPPVYTLGKSGDESNMLVAEEYLKSKGASLYRIDRGGDVTFHGPGQLVGYPILDLEKLGMGLREYIHSVEQAVIETVAEFGISGTRVEGAAGVWLRDGGPLRKICAIGVRSSRYVTMHGFALNVNTDLSWFDLINPCGFSDRGVTSIGREAGKSISPEDVKRLFADHFGRILNIKIKY